MANIIDYARESKLAFSELPLHAVDSLVLSQLSYLNFGESFGTHGEAKNGIPLYELAKNVLGDTAFLRIRDGVSNRALVYALSTSPRFRGIRFTDYVNKLSAAEEKQFSAVTFLLPDGNVYVAFRGTDSTFVGWKEDFNMSFTCPVPAQEEAVRYLEQAALRHKGRIYVGGHSKGGNLASYAAIFCAASVFERIETVFSHDGPGFLESVLALPQYNAASAKIKKTVPESSVIGMLLQSQESYEVVRSDRLFLMQHDPFSWLVQENDFLRVKAIKGSAQALNKTVHDWLGELSPQQRMLFVDVLFNALSATDAKTLREFMEDPHKNLMIAAGAAKKIDDDTRAFLSSALRSLFAVGIRAFRADPTRRISLLPEAVFKLNVPPEALEKLRLPPETLAKLKALPGAVSRLRAKCGGSQGE